MEREQRAGREGKAKGRKGILSRGTGISENMEAPDFPGSPVVKNPPCVAGDMGSIPGQGTKIPQASEKLSLQVAATEPAN